MTSTLAVNEGGTDQRFQDPLRNILTDEGRGMNEKIQAVLRLGADRLGVEHGHLTRIDPAAGTHQSTEVSGPHPVIERGAVIDLSNSYCRMVLAENEALLLHNAPEQGWDDDPAYKTFGLGIYLGTKVIVNGQLYGTVCFVDQECREEAFTDADQTFLEAIAQGIGREIERARQKDELLEARHRGEQTERLLRQTQKVGQIGGWEYEPDRDLVEGTAQFSHFFGLPGHEALSLNDWLARFPPRVRDTVQTALHHCLNDGTSFDEEVPYRPNTPADDSPSAEGDHRWGRLQGHRVEREDGNRLSGTFQDVTERHRRGRKLRLFRQLVEQANDAVVVTEAAPLDEPGPRIEYVNPAFEEMTGYDADELLGRTPRILQGDDTDRAVSESLREALKNGETWEGETVNYRKDQTPYQLRWSVAPVRDEEGAIKHWMSIQRDVTEERDRENELRRQRNLLKQTQRLAGGWEADLRGDRIYWSDEVYRIHEVTPGTEITIEEGIEFYSPEVQPTIREAFQKCIEQKEPYDLELPLITAEGDRRWVRTVGAPTEEKEGEVVKVAGAFQDITERKEAEKALNKMAEAMEEASDGMALLNEEGVYTYMNQSHAEIFGYDSPAPFLGNTWHMCYGQDQIERFEEEVLPTVRREGTWHGEVTGTRNDGTSVPQQVTLTQLSDGGIICVTRDITERKRAERRLRESEQRFRKVFENAGIGIVIANDEGHFLQANPAFQSMMGYEEEELQGVHFSEISHPDDAELALDLFDELTSGKRDRYQIEKRYVQKDGEGFWGRLTVSLLELDEEQKPIALIEDIDDQKRYEEQLRTAKKEAEEAARLKSVMLANMSHEVRTPLTSMIGFSGILKDRLDEKSAKLARLIHKSGRRLEDTLEDALQLSQLEAGSYAPDRESLRLDALARQIVGRFEVQAEESAVSLEVDAGNDPVDAYADETAVRRVIINLLDNALKFTPEGGQVTIRTRVDESETPVLEVEDTGVGISEEALPGVFEAFKQESEGFTREYEGAGLGLSIVQKLVETLGGRIEVHTKKGEGTRMIVHLPPAE